MSLQISRQSCPGQNRPFYAWEGGISSTASFLFSNPTHLTQSAPSRLLFLFFSLLVFRNIEGHVMDTHTHGARSPRSLQITTSTLHTAQPSAISSTLLNERTSRSTLHQVVIVCMRLAFARRLACPIQKVTPSSCTIPFPVEFVAQQPTRPKHPGVSRQVLGTLPSKRLTRISINRRPASVLFRYFLPLLLLQYQNN
jgi:hypothetical protein